MNVRVAKGAVIRLMVGCFFSLFCAAACAANSEPREVLPRWQSGFLDIHHLSVAADATLVVYPDGTTLLFDAGGSDKLGFEKRAYPLKAASVRPNDTRRPGQWYAAYIQRVLRDASLQNRIDYALISHFDSDHYGRLRPDAPESNFGDYALTGITDVAESVPILTLIDRGYPKYDYPVDLRHHRRNNSTFQNYLNYVGFRSQNGQSTETLIVGDTQQLAPKYRAQDYAGFEVRNIKSNGTVYDPESAGSKELFQASDVINEKGLFAENPLSLAVHISYGIFDYFTGGDMTGQNDGTVPIWFDTETPVAAVLGEVDVLALNHHGVRDATNLEFALTLRPQVSVVHGRTSDHPGQEITHRLSQIDQPHVFPSLFGTYIHAETKVVYGPRMHRLLAEEQGHIVIRVYPPGDTFDVFVFDDRDESALRVLRQYGPFNAQD